MKFLSKTLKRHPDKTVLWVTHGGVKFSVLNSIFKLEGDHKKALNSGHTAVSVIEIDKKGNHKIHLVNCVKHLL
jgi:broad specificity phosphatase PhoE